MARDDRSRAALGYGLVILAVSLWSLNASLARFLLEDGIDPLRLSELRSAGAWIVLVLVVLLVRPRDIRIRRDEVLPLAFLGIAGFAAVYVTYFIAIERLEIGAALTLEYLAPLFLLLWLRFVHRRRLSPSLWAAMAVSLAGCVLVVRAYDPGSLDAIGVAAGVGAGVSYAIYLAGSERAGHRHPPHVTLVWAFGFATLFWLCVQPPWSFPFAQLDSAADAGLAAAVIIVGTLVPFGSMVAALRFVPAARAAVVATLEPVLSALFAYLIHDEALSGSQLAGILVVLAAVVWVQLQRPDVAAESLAPERGPATPPAARSGGPGTGPS